MGQGLAGVKVNQELGAVGGNVVLRTWCPQWCCGRPGRAWPGAAPKSFSLQAFSWALILPGLLVAAEGREWMCYQGWVQTGPCRFASGT